MKKTMGKVTTVARIMVLVLLFLVILYHTSPPCEMWVNEKLTYARNVEDFMKDVRYEVEPDKRKPSNTMREFYEDRDGVIRDLLERNLESFGDPHGGTVGSPLTDGFNVCLPANAMWIDGKIDLNRSSEHAEWQSQRKSN